MSSDARSLLGAPNQNLLGLEAVRVLCNKRFSYVHTGTSSNSAYQTGPFIPPSRSFHGGSEQFVHVDPSTSNEARTVIDAGEHPNMGSAKAEFNDAQYVKDLRGAFSSVPKPRARWQDRYLKLMIVGETGQGETQLQAPHHFHRFRNARQPGLGKISHSLGSAPVHSLPGD